jgi:hypothetical protein
MSRVSEIVKIALAGSGKQIADFKSVIRKHTGIEIAAHLKSESTVLKKISDIDLIISENFLPFHSSLAKKAPTISYHSANLLFSPENKIQKESLLRMVEETCNAIHFLKNRNKFLKFILTIAIRAFGANSGSIMLIDRNCKSFRLESASGLKISKMYSQGLNDGVAGRIFKNGKALLIQGKVGNEFSPLSRRYELVSSMCCPLKTEDTLIGVFNVNSTRKERKFEISDLKYLNYLSKLTSEIISTSLEHESGIYCISSINFTEKIRKIMHNTTPLQQKFSSLVKSFAKHFSSNQCNIYRYLHDSGIFSTYASSSIEINNDNFGKLKLNSFFTNHYNSSKSGFLVENISPKTSERYWYAGVPIKIDGELWGLIIVQLAASESCPDSEYADLGRLTAALEKELSISKAQTLAAKQSSQFMALSEFATTLSNYKSLEGFTSASVANSCLILCSESAVISTVEKSNQYKILNKYSQKKPDHLEKLCRLDEIIALKAATVKNTVYIPDLTESGYLPVNPFTRSVLSTCIAEIKGKSLVLSIYDKVASGEFDSGIFSSEDVKIFTSLCALLSKTIPHLIPEA